MIIQTKVQLAEKGYTPTRIPLTITNRVRSACSLVAHNWSIPMSVKARTKFMFCPILWSHVKVSDSLLLVFNVSLVSHINVSNDGSCNQVKYCYACSVIVHVNMNQYTYCYGCKWSIWDFNLSNRRQN